jgi:hypothetical protein
VYIYVVIFAYDEGFKDVLVTVSDMEFFVRPNATIATP